MIIIKRVIDICKKAFTKNRRPDTAVSSAQTPIIYSRDKHNVSRQLLSPNAQKVLYRLSNAGYEAYLVGGGVRDILLGIEPKDFDIATNATPEQIKSLFRNCRLIGRRFRLAHILFGREIIEVATFRGHHKNVSDDKNGQKISKQSEHGMLLRDNIYGSIEEDAERRDFTINALYYNIKNFSIYDFAGGVDDIAHRKIKLIGDPETRYREDPVRMLRAIRFSIKLNMAMSERTLLPIKQLAPLLINIPPARMFEEFNKLFLSGQALATVAMLREFDLFKYFFPATDQMLNQQTEHQSATDLSIELFNFIQLALTNTDSRIKNHQRVTPAFLFAAMLWHPLTEKIQALQQNTELSEQDRFFEAYNSLMKEQQQSIAIPKRFQLVMKDIWMLQHRLMQPDSKRAAKTFEHPKFRAGFDFLLLLAEIKPDLYATQAQWWQDFQQSSAATQAQMLKVLGSKRGPRSRQNKRRRYNKKSND